MVFSGFADVNIWMGVGFLLAALAVVGNDSLQTLGTYLSSNSHRTPKGLQMLFICGLTSVVLMLGWHLNGGDPAWGRLVVTGRDFPLPEPFSWVYLLPPIAVLVLTQWGAPVSTSFLLLASFQPASSGQLLISSLSGYVLAFCIGLAAYGIAPWVLERWQLSRRQQQQQAIGLWAVLQLCSTALLWSLWLVQDLANIFVFLPRRLDLLPMLLSTLVLCLGLCGLVVRGGGPLQAVLRSKTKAMDLRSATLIDLCFGVCLLFKAVLSRFPLSTTWVFLGLLAGRELALRLRDQGWDGTFSLQGPGSLAMVVGHDVWKASVGIGVSLLIAVGIQALVNGTHGP